MKFAVIDIEATCQESNKDFTMETIEIGAVILDDKFNKIAEYDSFIKPKLNPVLSDFCKQLTSITQDDVDKARSFPEVWKELTQVFNKEDVIMCSWGAYDRNQLIADLLLHGITEAPFWSQHVNLKEVFREVMKRGKSCGVAKALRIINISFDGTHHRGIDDARMIHKIADLKLKSYFIK